MQLTERGFSLIEVLVSIFILAVGVIGATAMHLQALQTAQQSSYQTHALHLGAGMADSMRNNATQMALADDANPYLQVDYQSPTTLNHSVNFSCYGGSGVCDAEELAHFDIEQLLQHIDKELPGGRVRICRDAQPWNTKAQRFEWDCENAPDASNASSSVPLVIKIGWQEKFLHQQISNTGLSAAPGMVLTVASYSK